MHDRGRVLADTAVLIADGGRVLSELATLRDQAQLFGPVVSNPTLWRALNEIGETQRGKIDRVCAKTRAHVWPLIAKRQGRMPPSRVADTDLGKTIVIRIDASLATAHSDKELAAGTYKGTWGHHLLEAWCGNTGKSLALLLRTGSAGSNTTEDHIAVLDEAIAQIPAPYPQPRLRSTSPGVWPQSSPVLCCAGSAYSASTGPSPRPNPRPCANGCCTPPPASCAANANVRSASPPPGPGPRNSPPACLPRSPCPHRPNIDHPVPAPDPGNHPGCCHGPSTINQPRVRQPQ